MTVFGKQRARNQQKKKKARLEADLAEKGAFVKAKAVANGIKKAKLNEEIEKAEIQPAAVDQVAKKVGGQAIAGGSSEGRDDDFSNVLFYSWYSQ